MLPILSAIAPNLLSSLAGPLSALATEILSKIFGKNITSAEEAETSAMAMSPSQLAELRQADVDFAAQYVRASEIDAGDRQDARIKNKDSGVTKFLAISVTAFTFLYIMWAAWFCTTYEVSKVIEMFIVGNASSLFTCSIMIITFYFGSSSSSRFKDQALMDKI